MRSRLFLAILALAGALASGAAAARVHWDFGIYLGPGYWPYAPYYAPYYYPPYPYYYPPYQYYYPPAPAPAPAPAPYVEQSAPPPPPQQDWWYYCASSKTYYPYVRECAGGWQRVSPEPPR